jgi:hypothetical protein
MHEHSAASPATGAAGPDSAQPRATAIPAAAPRVRDEPAMTETEAVDRVLDAMSDLRAIFGEVDPEVAARSWQSSELEVFWREWPEIKSWADGLWGRLDRDLAQPATPVRDPELDEVGGGD